MCPRIKRIGKLSYLKIAEQNPQAHCDFHVYQWSQEVTCEETQEANKEMHTLVLRNHIGELQTYDQVQIDGNVESHPHYPPDHLQALCWETEAILREGYTFLLDSCPQLSRSNFHEGKKKKSEYRGEKRGIKRQCISDSKIEPGEIQCLYESLYNSQVIKYCTTPSAPKIHFPLGQSFSSHPLMSTCTDYPTASDQVYQKFSA